MPEMIPISEIDLNHSVQVRSETDSRAIHDYGEHWRSGGEFPPVILYRVDGDLLLADGWHRVLGVQKAGPPYPLFKALEEGEGGRKIHAEVREGTYDDYLEAAMAANAAHGVRLTNQDKRKIVELALKQWPGQSAREIAEKVKVVSHELVNTVRNEIDEAAKARAKAKKEAKDRKAKGEATKPAADPKLETVAKMAKTVQAAFENLSAAAKRSISYWELDRLKEYRAEEAAEILQTIASDYKNQLTITSARHKILQRRMDAAFGTKGEHGVLTLTSKVDWDYVRGAVGSKTALVLHLVGATKRDWDGDSRLDRKDKQGPCYFVPEHLIGPFLADSTSGNGAPFTRLELLMGGDKLRGLTVRVVEKYGRLIESTEVERIESTLEDRIGDLIAEHKDQGPILDLSGTVKIAALAKHHGATLWSLCETEAQTGLVREALGLDEGKPAAAKKPSLAKAAKAAAKPAPEGKPAAKGKAARPPKGKAPVEPAPEAEAPAEPEAVSA